MIISFSSYVKQLKSMALLMLLIQPWPPQDFGMLIDSLGSFQLGVAHAGMNKDAFTMFSKAIFGNDVLIDENIRQKVIYCIYVVIMAHTNIC
jgi:hypothetical protein